MVSKLHLQVFYGWILSIYVFLPNTSLLPGSTTRFHQKTASWWLLKRYWRTSRQFRIVKYEKINKNPCSHVKVGPKSTAFTMWPTTIFYFFKGTAFSGTGVTPKCVFTTLKLNFCSFDLVLNMLWKISWDVEHITTRVFLTLNSLFCGILSPQREQKLALVDIS